MTGTVTEVQPGLVRSAVWPRLKMPALFWSMIETVVVAGMPRPPPVAFDSTIENVSGGWIRLSFRIGTVKTPSRHQPGR